jgi:hypothetical protein
MKTILLSLAPSTLIALSGSFEYLLAALCLHCCMNSWHPANQCEPAKMQALLISVPRSHYHSNTGTPPHTGISREPAMCTLMSAYKRVVSSFSQNLQRLSNQLFPSCNCSILTWLENPAVLFVFISHARRPPQKRAKRAGRKTEGLCITPTYKYIALDM